VRIDRRSSPGTPSVAIRTRSSRATTTSGRRAQGKIVVRSHHMKSISDTVACTVKVSAGTRVAAATLSGSFAVPLDVGRSPAST